MLLLSPCHSPRIRHLRFVVVVSGVLRWWVVNKLRDNLDKPHSPSPHLYLSVKEIV